MGAYKFRVLLDSEKDEEIFRDIVINKKDSFESFYNAILASFHFEGNQMASFYMSNDNWDKGFEITLMDMSYDEELVEPTVIMGEQKLSNFIQNADQKLILVHDFMRMWIFLIELIDLVEEDVETPKVAMAVGIAPPEDSKMMDLNDEFGEDELNYSEEDAFENDFENDFEDGYDEDDYSNYDEYDY